MRVCFFDTHSFEKEPLNSANSNKFELNFLDVRLDTQTAILARSYECVCAFVNDKLSREVLTILKEGGTNEKAPPRTYLAVKLLK